MNQVAELEAEIARLREALTEARKWLAVNYEEWVTVFTQIDAALKETEK